MTVTANFQELVEKWFQEAGKNFERQKKLAELMYQDPEPAVGLTPKEVVWTRNKAKLYRFVPQKDTLHPVPVLMVYALINKPYILDLCPGNSLVEFLVSHGFDVYMLDWGTAGPEDKGNTYDTYVLDYMPDAVARVLKTARAEQLTLIGYCMGGTFTAMYAGVHPTAPVKNMVFLAAPIDFSDAGLFSKWLDEKYFNVDKMVDVMGNIPADAIDIGNKMLKPVSNFYGAYTNLWERMWDSSFVENWKVLNKWVNDGVPFPGEAFRQWIKEFYQRNRLVKGELYLRGQRVDLSRIKCPVLNLTASRDHIVPEGQSMALKECTASSDYEHVSVPAGHVSLVIGRQAQKVTWQKVRTWLEGRQYDRQD